MPSVNDPTRTRRIELILHEVESIPTPSPIAVRLLTLAADESVEVNELVSLIEADPGMTARLLGVCRRSVTGLGGAVKTVERAIVMLGLDAVRAMLLSVDIHEFMTTRPQDDLDVAGAAEGDSPAHIDRIALWRHALAVACAAERIVQTHNDQFADIKPDEAFVCGLLHDIGKIALDMILPRSLHKAMQLAERRCETLASMEKSLIGIDHTLVGKRLAEKWGLPELIRDVIWLHGRPARSIPDLPHKKVIGVVSAANDLARLMHVGFSGSSAPPRTIASVAQEWGFDAERLENIAVSLHERVSARSLQLGMEEAPAAELLVQSLGVANRTLVQLNDMHRKRSAQHAQLDATVKALQSFTEAAFKAKSSLDIFQIIAQCGRTLFGPSSTIGLIRVGRSLAWSVLRIDEDGRMRQSVQAALTIDSSTIASDRAQPALDSSQLGVVAAALELNPADLAGMRPLTLHVDDASTAVLLHEWRFDRERGVVLSAWSAAMSGALTAERAARQVEELTELNSEIVSMQSRAAEIESFARLGELTAGAAHEMNNPLAVISGRAQLLRDLHDDESRDEAIASIVEAAERLSDLIANLHFIATPPALRRSPVDLTALMPKVIKKVRQERAEAKLECPPVRLVVRGALPPAHLDAPLFSVAVEELLRNALEAEDSRRVELHIQTEDSDDRLIVSVQDDGRGIAPEILAHVADPFFSSKKAGRQTGMGLAKVRRIVDLHGGRMELGAGASGVGTEARIILHCWRPEHLGESNHAADALAA